MTEQAFPSSASPAAAPRRLLATALWVAVVVGALGSIAYHARTGAVSPRIANPEVTDAPRPVEFGWGSDFPIQEMQWGTVGMMLLLGAVCVRAWMRRPGHPNVLMVLAATGIVWQDPIMNWAPYAVYNPQLWHWPEDWPLVNTLTHGRAVRRHRLRDLLLRRALLPVHLDPAPPPGTRVRPTRSSGATRCSASGCCSSSSASSSTRCWRSSRPRRALHLLAGDAVGLALRRNDLSVPADLGVVARHGGDDPRRHPLSSGRHGTHAGREAGPEVRAGSRSGRPSARS